MPQLDRDGVKIHYEIHGSGPTLLLSHGYSSTARMWDGQVAALKDRYQVVVWDFRGHGESDYPTDGALYSEELTVGDMQALLDTVGAKKAIVAGLSLGGYMSLAFHASHPERVRALMLFDTGPGFKKDEARAKWNESAQARAARFDAEGLRALNQSDEVKLTRHRDATGLAGSARGTGLGRLVPLGARFVLLEARAGVDDQEGGCPLGMRAIEGKRHVAAKR